MYPRDVRVENPQEALIVEQAGDVSRAACGRCAGRGWRCYVAESLAVRGGGVDAS
jgi:hypothetical protein